MTNKEIELRTLEIGTNVRHYSEGRFHGIWWKQVSKQRGVGFFQPHLGEGRYCLVHRLHHVAVINVQHIPDEITPLPQPYALIMGEEFRTIFHEIVRIHRERLVFLLDQRIDVFRRSIGTCLQMRLQNAPDLLSANWILSGEKTRGIRNSLHQMAIGILRELIFYQRLDAHAEFLLCDFEELL